MKPTFMIHVIQTDFTLLLPSPGRKRRLLALLGLCLLARGPLRRFFLFLLNQRSLVIIRQPHSDILCPILSAISRIEINALARPTRNDDTLYLLLLHCALSDSLLNCTSCNHAVDGDLLRLTQAMGTIHSL